MKKRPAERRLSSRGPGNKKAIEILDLIRGVSFILCVWVSMWEQTVSAIFADWCSVTDKHKMIRISRLYVWLYVLQHDKASRKGNCRPFLDKTRQSGRQNLQVKCTTTKTREGEKPPFSTPTLHGRPSMLQRGPFQGNNYKKEKLARLMAE